MPLPSLRSGMWTEAGNDRSFGYEDFKKRLSEIFRTAF